MWRLTLLFAAPRRSSPTVDPEVCLLGFLWRDLTWSNAKTPTGSAFGGNLSLCLSQVKASMSGCFWFAGSIPETSAPQAFWTETWSRRTSVPTFTASWRNTLRPTRPTGPAKTCVPRSRRPLFLSKLCTLVNVWLTSCVFGSSSLLVLRPGLQRLLHREHPPATSPQQPLVTVMPFKCCCFRWYRKCFNVFMCSDGSTGRKNALYPSISIYKSETSGQFSSELFELSFN